MPTEHFKWHPSAQAFAANRPVPPQTGLGGTLVPATPPEDSLAALSRSLSRNTGFCVSDKDIPALDSLAPHQFATLTGGTSGAPKVIVRSQASWIRSFEINARLFDYQAGDRVAVLGPLDHSLALYGTLEALHLGLPVHVLSGLTRLAQARSLEQQRGTILYATPTQLRLLPAQTPLPHIRLILCGGGALGPVVHDHIKILCPNAALHVFYGAAETSFVTLGTPRTPKGSVGRAYPGVQIDVRAPDSDGIGTVWVKSPYVCDRYLQGHSLHTARDGDWMTVGELGRLDQNGDLFLSGRAGRAVTIMDQTVYLDTLEAQISAHPDIPPCVLIAQNDSERGQSLVAVLESPALADMHRTLVAHCKAKRLHVPRRCLFLDPFPLLSSGKPDLAAIGLFVKAAS